MIEIYINGILLQTLAPIKEVRGIEIRTMNFRVPMPRAKAKSLVDFLYEATQRCTGVITYNNVIIDKADVKEIKL